MTHGAWVCMVMGREYKAYNIEYFKIYVYIYIICVYLNIKLYICCFVV